ncbi:MAG: EamA family transporter [Halocynthiibacter sp.]
MSIGIFAAILMAALLHATWNALIKTGTAKVTGMVILCLLQGGLGAVGAAYYGLPPAHVWPWIMGSVVFHTGYNLFLGYAYEQGDLSRVYPIARGAAPMFVLIFGMFFLSDSLRIQDYVGIGVLGIGIFIMASGVFTRGEERRLLPYAFGSALATAGYTIVDGLGARSWGDAIAYVNWMFVVTALLFPLTAIGLRGPAVLRATRATWMLGAGAAVGSYLSYAIVVWAMTQAPLALVAALRESSILFAVLIGVLFFKDHMDRSKIIAACFIVAGMILTRI